MPTSTLSERFWAKVSVRSDGECWLWTGALRGGYGWFSRGPRRLGQVGAHRLSWELEHGHPAPKGLEVRHKSDNPPCVNPNHLELGTHAQNMRDRVERGRQIRGSQSPLTKLTDCDVWAIRSAPSVKGVVPMLAERFGLTERAIEHHRHANPASFKHIPSAREIREGGLPARQCPSDCPDHNPQEGENTE